MRLRAATVQFLLRNNITIWTALLTLLLDEYLLRKNRNKETGAQYGVFRPESATVDKICLLLSGDPSVPRNSSPSTLLKEVSATPVGFI